MLSSEFLGILFIIQVIKYVFSVTLRIFHLHRELGCGIWILSAVWSSLANCILHENIKKRLPDDEHKNRCDSPDPPPPPPNSEYVTMFSFPGRDKPAYDVCQPSTGGSTDLPYAITGVTEPIPEPASLGRRPLLLPPPLPGSPPPGPHSRRPARAIRRLLQLFCCSAPARRADDTFDLVKSGL